MSVSRGAAAGAVATGAAGGTGVSGFGGDTSASGVWSASETVAVLSSAGNSSLAGDSATAFLISGISKGLARNSSKARLVGAEPLLANDAARSLKAGEIISNEKEPQTIADGARTLRLGALNWEIIKTGVAQILEVSDEKIREAVRLYFSLANFKSEPTGALSLGAILENGDKLLAEDPPKIDFAAGYALANLAADGKKTEAAEKYYRFILSLRKERAGLVLEELGSHYAEVKKYAEAAKVYQEAIDDPALAENRPSFLYQLSRVLELGGNTEAALKAITSAQQVIPNNPLLRFQEGWVYYHSHRFDEAFLRRRAVAKDHRDAGARSSDFEQRRVRAEGMEQARQTASRDQRAPHADNVTPLAISGRRNTWGHYR